MNLYKVETLVQFKHTYFIRAKELSHAFDEVVMEDAGDAAAQSYLGETILSGREVTKEEFDKFLVDTKETKESSWWMGDDLIHELDYGDTIQFSNSNISPAIDSMVNDITRGVFDTKDTLTITTYSTPAPFYASMHYEDRQ